MPTDYQITVGSITLSNPTLWVDAPVDYAIEKLPGSKQTLEETALGVQGTYPIGTKIWAGNESHVLALSDDFKHVPTL